MDSQPVKKHSKKSAKISKKIPDPESSPAVKEKSDVAEATVSIPEEQLKPVQENDGVAKEAPKPTRESEAPKTDGEEDATDEDFDYGQRARKAVLPPLKDIWQTVPHMGIPQINLDKEPSVFVVLDFLYRMQRYRVEQKELVEPILITAC